jgi:hypothetical protein
VIILFINLFLSIYYIIQYINMDKITQYLKQINTTTYIIIGCLVSASLFLAAFLNEQALVKKISDPNANYISQIKTAEYLEPISNKLYSIGLVFFIASIAYAGITLINKQHVTTLP